MDPVWIRRRHTRRVDPVWWVVAVLACAGCDGVFALDPPRWYESHAFRKPLEIRPPTFATLADFPVGVVLERDRDFAGVVEADELVFTAADGETRLDHEIEHYDRDTGALVAWVRVPELAGPTRIYVYYGAPAEAWPSADTWEPRFGAVWHMSGDSRELDSTRNANTLSQQSAVRSVRGVLGRARSFTGGDDRLVAPHHDSLDASGGQGSLTYSLWVWEGDTTEDYASPLFKGGNLRENPGYCVQLGQRNWTTSIADGGEHRIAVLSPVPLGDWIHVAGVVDRERSELRAYLNGVKTDVLSLGTFGAYSSSGPLMLSSDRDPYTGDIDEVRIYRGALPAEWILTEYANVTDPAFLTVGDVQRAP
jgi:MSHA biogenesis protein MshQ